MSFCCIDEVEFYDTPGPGPDRVLICCSSQNFPKTSWPVCRCKCISFLPGTRYFSKKSGLRLFAVLWPLTRVSWFLQHYQPELFETVVHPMYQPTASQQFRQQLYKQTSASHVAAYDKGLHAGVMTSGALQSGAHMVREPRSSSELWLYGFREGLGGWLVSEGWVERRTLGPDNFPEYADFFCQLL